MTEKTNRQTAAIADVRAAWVRMEGKMPPDYVTLCVEIGDDLLTAQEDLGWQGISFQSMFPERDSEHKSEDRMPFRIDMAKRFMCVSRNEVARSSAHAHLFPKDITSVAELARMDAPRGQNRHRFGQPYAAPRLLKAIEAEKIHPAMSRFDVQQVRAVYGPEKPWVDPETIRRQQFARAQRAVLGLNPTQQQDLFDWFRAQLAKAA